MIAVNVPGWKPRVIPSSATTPLRLVPNTLRTASSRTTSPLGRFAASDLVIFRSQVDHWAELILVSQLSSRQMPMSPVVDDERHRWIEDSGFCQAGPLSRRLSG
jgi:hypothetical protein